jgi:hypothetical protein
MHIAISTVDLWTNQPYACNIQYSDALRTPYVASRFVGCLIRLVLIEKFITHHFRHRADVSLPQIHGVIGCSYRKTHHHHRRCRIFSSQCVKSSSLHSKASLLHSALAVVTVTSYNLPCSYKKSGLQEDDLAVADVREHQENAKRMVATTDGKYTNSVVF